MWNVLRRVGRAIADAIAPERCASCGAVVAACTLFCHACRAAVNVLGPPECPRCGRPLSTGASCADCARADPGAVRAARAVARYDAGAETCPVADALRAFKYEAAWRLAPRLARAMVPRVPDATAAALVVPVPLHVTRLRQRGFNQSAMLAAHVARALGWSVAPRLLMRTRPTPSQTALTADARRANVADAFAVRLPRAARGRRVLLIDDVWTSGATARAAATALRADGATAVDVLTFARVV